MEIAYLIVALIVAAACVFCYRQGLKDGRCIKEDRPIEKIVQIETTKKEEKTEELTMEQQYANMMNFKSGVKHD